MDAVRGEGAASDPMFICINKKMKFNHNGIGKLADAQSCTVTEKRNGSYELKLVCPADGIHAEMLEEGNIILAKPSDTMQSQPFRIYKDHDPDRWKAGSSGSAHFLPAELHHSFPVLSDWVCGSNAGAEKPRCF
ncbi:MAG: hypothetical protein ACLSCD_04880 [Subdoligranulum sp.]